MQAFARFYPGGAIRQESLTPEPGGDPSAPLDPNFTVLFQFSVPEDAVALEMWFASSNIYGCRVWDSRYGQNYRFPVV